MTTQLLDRTSPTRQLDDGVLRGLVDLLRDIEVLDVLDLIHDLDRADAGALLVDPSAEFPVPAQA